MHNKSLIKKSQSLPKLQKVDFNESKLFQNSQTLNEAKSVFLALIRGKEQRAGIQQGGMKINKKGSLIQLPKINEKNGFVSFKAINQNETNEFLNNLSKLRSKSTIIKSHIKAQILSNYTQMQKILRETEEKKLHENQYITQKLKEMAPSKMKKQVQVRGMYKNKQRIVRSVNLTMDFNIYENNLQAWKPYIDYQSICVGLKSKFYFVGGRKITPIAVYDASSDKWSQLPENPKIKPFGDTEGTLYEEPKTKKTYHIFFGGNYYYQPNFTEITNNIKLIDLIDNSIEVREFLESKIQARAYHSQCLYGRYLIISGGLDKRSRPMSTFMNYNIDQKFWSQLVISKCPQQLKRGFAKHNTLSIFHPRKTYSIYDDEQITRMDPLIKIEGVYIFGGEDYDGNLNSKIFIMKLGSPSVEIIEPKIDGKGPLARRNAKMVRSGQFLIIHGGRNDEMKPFVLNSMHFLNLLSMSWIKVEGQKPPYRFGHALTSEDSRIIIMGGKGVQGLTKQVFVMNYSLQIEFI